MICCIKLLNSPVGGKLSPSVLPVSEFAMQAS